MKLKNRKENDEIILTQEYILDHAAGVHTYESFGRGIVQAMLMGAAEQVKQSGQMDEVVLDAKVHITPNTEKECITVCIDTIVGRICVHADVEFP